MSPDLRTRLESTFGGQYAIERELGGGGMSHVFLARDVALGRRVVIKVLSAELTATVSVKRFEREIRLAATLQQANIVPVLAAGDADGAPYYTMPFVEGLSLRQRLSGEGRPPLSDTIDILRDVARALSYAHEHGVVHRDIKPENILLSGGAAVVTDFGIAKALANARLPNEGSETGAGTLTRTGTVIGTPPYMAPEQITADPGIDHRADLYSFGCVAYELLAGRAPFGTRSVQPLLAAHLMEQPAPIGEISPGCPPALARMVMRCLEKDPAARPQSANEILATLGTIATAATPFERFRQRLTRRQRLGMLTLALLIAISGATFAIRARATGRDGHIQSLAVLPLENLSGNPGQEFFADGMHEGLITELSKLSGLERVIARPSVMRYRRTDKPLAQIARELGVQAIVTGAVQQSGDTVRVTAQLISAVNEQQLWSEQYQRELRDVLSIQDEIVKAITREIKLKLTIQERTRMATTRSVNPEAYEAYLKGRFNSNSFNAASLETAMRYFQSALEKEPNYAQAYAGIGQVWWLKGNMLYTSFSEAHRQAKSAALQTIALDENLPDGHDILGRVLFWYEWDWKGAEKEYRRAIALNPNYPDAHQYYSTLLMAQGRPREAEPQIERAIELDPLNSSYQVAYAYQLGQMRRYDEAIAKARKTLGIAEQSNAMFLHEVLWRAYHQKRMYREALAEIRTIFAADPEIVDALSRGFAEDGYAEANRQAAEKLSARGRPTFWERENATILWAFAGQKAKALDWLEKGYETRHPMMGFIAVDPHWDALRDQPRFRELLRKLNLPAISTR